MAATRLSIYNGALLACGDRKLLSLTEASDRRRMLDLVWDSGGVDTCLQAGLWNFASRSLQLDFDPDLTPPFGFQKAFSKATDWIRTMAVCSDEYFNQPLTQYLDEGKFLFSDLSTIWVRYVSNDADYGCDFSSWPENFTRFVELYFASRIVNRLVQSKEAKDEVRADLKMIIAQAKSTDAMSEPTAVPPLGSWASSRMGGRRSRLDRGNRGSLIG